MPPRWFNNIRFGKDLTNVAHIDVVEDFKRAFKQNLEDVTFDITGPIIEEVESEDELDFLVPDPPGSFKDAPEIFAPVAPAPEIPAPVDSEPEIDAPEDPELEDLELEDSESENFEADDSEPEDFEPEDPEPEDPEPELPAPVVAEHEISAPVVAEDEISAPVVPEPEDLELELPAPEEPEPEIFAPVNPEPEVSSPVNPEPEFSEPVTTAREISFKEASREVSAPRRSQRQRRKPVDFARGERIVYNMNKSFVAYEEGFPQKYNYGPKRKYEAKAKKPISLPKNCRPIDPVALRVAKKGNYRFACKQVGDLIEGSIVLGPRMSKPEAKTTPNQEYSFFIAKGQVLLKFTNHRGSDTIYVDDNHQNWVDLPRGMRYSFRNCGVSEATIAYIVRDSNRD